VRANLSRTVHDMRNRLALIKACAYLLEPDTPQEAQQEAGRQILRAAEQLSDDLDRLVAPTLDPRIQREGLTAAARRRRRRIVVADDDPLVRELLRITLPADQFDVVETHDGSACLAAVERERPDLLVLDWFMPRVTGREVLREMHACHPDVPVIVLTGSLPARVPPAAELGADALLTKPFSPLELLATIEALLLSSTYAGDLQESGQAEA
jgi:CheY-like chemotaxis protein